MSPAVALVACGGWLILVALADLRLLPGVPQAWGYGTPVLVAALVLPPRHVIVLALAALGLYLSAAMSQQAPLGEVSLFGLGVVTLSGMAVVWARHQQAEKARAARQAAEAAALRNLDRLRSDLIATISHELRTPLTVVHGYAQVLQTRAATADPAWVAQTAARIHARSSDLIQLVNDLLDAERVGRGEVTLRLAEFDLAPLLHDLAQSWHAQASGERLRTEIPDHLLVRADRLRIRQVVSNLVENALKYAPESGVVLRARVAGEQVRIEVEDRGPGIPVEEQQRIWERLYRGRAVAQQSVLPGSGIGLAVVKALVEAHGGSVGLESTPGWGARFCVTLPAAGQTKLDRQVTAASTRDEAPLRIPRGTSGAQQETGMR